MKLNLRLIIHKFNVYIFIIMKIDTLKTIIRESVREAVREELKTLLTEIIYPSPTKNEAPARKSEIDNKRSTSSGDPIAEMLNITKNSMNSQDFSNILNTGYKPELSEIKFTSDNFSSTTSNQGVSTGLDISKLDFVKNAALIFNKSMEKDKARMA